MRLAQNGRLVRRVVRLGRPQLRLSSSGPPKKRATSIIIHRTGAAPPVSLARGNTQSANAVRRCFLARLMSARQLMWPMFVPDSFSLLGAAVAGHVCGACV